MKTFIILSQSKINLNRFCEGGELFDAIKKLKYFSEQKAAEVMK